MDRPAVLKKMAQDFWQKSITVNNKNVVFIITKQKTTTNNNNQDV